jgi:hypothetical protein
MYESCAAIEMRIQISVNKNQVYVVLIVLLF